MLLLLPLLACQPTDTGPWAEREGDADAGWQTLLYGDFVGAGVPADIWFELVGPMGDNVLGRTGRAADLPPSFNVFEARNGVEVVGGLTCLGCHGGMLDGEFIPGLGNHWGDFTNDESNLFELAGLAVENRYGSDSPEYEAFWPFGRGATAVSGAINVPFLGPNSAFGLERTAVSWRDPDTLEWQREQQFIPPETVMAADPPAWWLTKKKDKLYWSGGGRGDQARLITQISMVAIDDVEHFQHIEDSMVDVLAWIRELAAPPFPGPIDSALSADGALVFEAHCRHCHGTYDEPETYPGLIIPLADVGTDPVYAQGFLEPPDFVDWLRDSWMAETEPYAAAFEPELGYVAPPLDGIWATAPYLHNGSVPDLVTLLDSSQRPASWQRSFSDSRYDKERLGWPWTEAEPGIIQVYDTSVSGFSNQGHTYADSLSDTDRTALLEFLKTL